MNRSSNLWTTAATGGKFKALSPLTLRVKSESAQKAMADVFEFYKKYAAAAYIKSPMYDKGTRLNQKLLVSKCEVDSSRATNVALERVPAEAYKHLRTDREHILNFLKLNKTPINDEQIASLVSEKPFSADGFERREQIQRVAAMSKAEMAKAPNRYIVLEGALFLGDYDFNDNTFDLSSLKSDAEKYVYESARISYTKTPKYNLTVPAKFLVYKPNSTNEAKRIERARSQTSNMRLKSYIQITEASSAQGVVIKANLAAIEVRTQEGELLFNLNAL
ncbi:hypothetical protein [Massilia sp. KIM]|uniref:hypothetical protein n=1 Tax=Massilia sp. KIM TaxID=1955422 RepID=UPI00117CC249|nr:hypothetical protein [Massilia sp. KIM]